MFASLLPTLALVCLAQGGDVEKAHRGPDTPKPMELRLTVSPAGEPVPALKYRLLPMAPELTAGDAAPIYLRLRQSWGRSYEQVVKNSFAWERMPLDTFPVDEARKLLGSMPDRLRQMAFAARRSTCDWSYTLPEQRLEATELFLPDVIEMRVWGHVLALKARVEMIDRGYDEAIRTCETGLAMGRHVASGPFLMNGAIGAGICHLSLGRLEELVGQPGAPNLYWALTALPRPLLSARDQQENEQHLAEMMVPELVDALEPHTPDEWKVLLATMYARLQSIAARMGSSGQESAALASFRATDLATYRRNGVEEARKRLGSVGAGATDDEILARDIALGYARYRDSRLRYSYLPFEEAGPLLRKWTAGQQDAVGALPVPVAVLTELPAGVLGLEESEITLDRRVAALRVVEAIRLYAHANDGKLPTSLGAIELVPIPVDPATNRLFDYKLDGETASLTAPGVDPLPPALDYRIRIRKAGQ